MLLVSVPEFQKSVEEEKKEHGDKVSKLLHWVSSVNGNVSKDEKVGKDGKATSESSSKPKVMLSTVYLFIADF